MHYHNLMSEPITIENKTIAPYFGVRSLKPKEGVIFVLPMKMWLKVRHRADVISIYKGDIYGFHSIPAHRTA